ALLDLDAAHGQRCASRPHPAESLPPSLGLAQHLQIDLDAVHLLHAADVGVTELLEGIHERTRAIDARGRIDHLVAMNLAAPALELVLRPERKLGRGCGCGALRWLRHDGIFMPKTTRRKT